tara:strand:- start:45 stop:707 length:663 start_codon:yes stop_codon:yes gene_type:complete
MAKESKSTRAVTGPRVMNLAIPSTLVTNPAGTFVATNGWEVLANNVVYYENYFDLSAYELDDLTVVPTALTLQDGLPYYSTGPQPDLQLATFDIISQERLSMQEVYDNYTASNGYPSSPTSTQDWTQLLMCNFRLQTLQTDFQSATLLLPATGGALGSGEATAVQKLWVYRILIPVTFDTDGLGLSIPATRFVAATEVIKEDELPYMMRLKRSYELATQG